MIAPYWADVDIRNGGEIFYRQSTNFELLQRATNDVRRFFPNQFPSFQASWIFTATWLNVTRFRHDRSLLRIASTKKNTFQVVIITNGRHSFILFNYDKIEWTIGDAGKTIHGGIPAQAGYDSGDGHFFFNIKGQKRNFIRRLPLLSNVGVPGTFMFRVDIAETTKGGCNTAGSLTLKPRRGLVLGGTFVEISGPCFNVISDNIVCRFDESILADGNVINRFKAYCVTPPLRRIGKMSLELSLDDAKTFKFASNFTSVAIGRHGPGISGLKSKDWTTQLKPLFIAWNPHKLRTRDLVDVQIAQFDWENFELLDKPFTVKYNVSNYGFDLLNNVVDSVPTLDDMIMKNDSSPLSILSIRAPKPALGLAPRIFSAPFLLFPTKVDDVNASKKCHDWFRKDKFNVSTALDELIGCPRSLQQAEADTARFASDDYCKPPRTGSCMTYHNGSYHCFRSVFPSPSGAGQQCCYTQEGHLVVGPPGGGTVDRYHAGSSRYATLKHLKHDIYPWYLCCKLSKNCGLYYRRRPSVNGARYRPPQIATTFGDPHLVTLDGLSYTFNGYGEYTMLSIDVIGFKFQARMQPLLANGRNTRGTFLMAFVLKDDQSDKVQVEFNSLHKVDLLVNGVSESFEATSTFMDFTNLLLMQQNNSNVHIIFKSGISVTVIPNDDSLSFEISISEKFRGKTKGLLGVWDDDVKNDFTLPNGEKVDVNSNSSAIHWTFGQKWLIDEATSLFTYGNGKNHNDFINTQYKPLFFDEIKSLFIDKRLEIKAKAICGDVKECLFDVAASGSVSFGKSTKQAIDHFTKIKKDINTVRSPLYFNCDGMPETEACSACHSQCSSPRHHSVAISILTIIIGVIVCSIFALAISYCVYKANRKEAKTSMNCPKSMYRHHPRVK
ncbi:sushi domain-containing protein 2-like [Xenia sp. Carnegie-2017]|uniref:sushi domain-containing protein 2-like n=1 Tax=Xenia sp. Carnegie-2017 TaxID=2897299 RepID=UPI001F0418F2|nr:sushi domain-containing protein 2-like [Xenia sp. Carnegie-2017]